VNALTWNPLVKAHYERLFAAGKVRMVALAAAMRKMLMICYGALKHQKPSSELAFSAIKNSPLHHSLWLCCLFDGCA
jgi:hypothetical protein